MPAHPRVRYFAISEDELDVEVSVHVTDRASGSDAAQIGSLPGGTGLVVEHIGGHETLAEAYRVLAAAAPEADLTSNGPPYEVYKWIEGRQALVPVTWLQPADWRTDVIQPLVATQVTSPFDAQYSVSLTIKPGHNPDRAHRSTL